MYYCAHFTPPPILVQVNLKFQFITENQHSCQSSSKGKTQPEGRK